MRVLIHALGADMGGAVRHLTNFLPELGRQNSAIEYVVLVRESLPEQIVAENVHIERVSDLASSSWIGRLTHDVFALPIRLRREGFSLTVSLTNFGPIWSHVPHVLFQRNSLFYCPYYLGGISGRQKGETLLRRCLAVESMKRAALIVTPSHAMADMIRETCPQVRNREFRTLFHGYDRNALSAPLDQSFRSMLGSSTGARLLYPTHAAFHKGFDVLFDALALLRKRGIKHTLFATIEDADWPQGVHELRRQIIRLGIEDSVRFVGRVPQQQMGALYESCDLMVYPSLCESFGFSMIEAMGHGLPIVASGTAVNREICVAGALYYDPLNSEAAANCIEEALIPAVRENLRLGGTARVEGYDWGWSRYAREFAVILNSVI